MHSIDQQSTVEIKTGKLTESCRKTIANDYRMQGCRQANLLLKTTEFLHQRIYHTIDKDIFHENVEAYGKQGNEQVLNFLNTTEWSFSISSLHADPFTNKVIVEYEYQSIDEISLKLRREIISFNIDESDSYNDSAVICKVQSTFEAGDSNTLEDMLRKQSNNDGLEGDIIGERAMKSVRTLRLAMTFLYYDIFQLVDKQKELLTDRSVAFSGVGDQEIAHLQHEGIESGTYYSLPFPIMVDTDAACLIVDFFAHNSKDRTYKQRGTDIMYVDINEHKILRIDTLRHVLNQPEWVRKHFQICNLK